MNSAVCTLFEGHYHHGVAALANSLYKNGFRGSIYAGYRGPIPRWAASSEENPSLVWRGASTLKIDEGLQVHFLPLNTKYHLSSCKPDFMLNLWEGPAKNADAVAYFDPDIVVKCRWKFFESWMNYGVAVVHDITDNDMPLSHPIRLEWENVLKRYDFKIERKLSSYINSGFCGVKKSNKQVLENWKFLIEKGIADYKMNPELMISFDKSFPFCFLDQDSFNMALIGSDISLSEMGPSAMDLIPGGWTMSHALGSPKPWQKKIVLSALKGNVPSLAEKAFWFNVTGPVITFNTTRIKLKRTSLKVASFIGRFYRRN